jgi:mRNA interferase RelE/StbE
LPYETTTIIYILPMAEVLFSRNAQKAIDRLPKERKRQVRERIEALATGGSVDVKPLSGRPGYRLRVGRYRVIFRRQGDTIEVLDLAARGSVY